MAENLAKYKSLDALRYGASLVSNLQTSPRTSHFGLFNTIAVPFTKSTSIEIVYACESALC